LITCFNVSILDVRSFKYVCVDRDETLDDYITDNL